MYKQFEVEGHKICADNAFINDLFGITEEIGAKLDKYTIELMENSSNVENELKQLIDLYPEIPQFKNLLATYYLYNDNITLAYEINDIIISKHPNFILASIIKASTYLNGESLEMVRTILGESFEIEKFAPQRKLFFLDEIVAYYKVVAIYFILQHDKDNAQKHLSFLKAVGPKMDETLFVENCFESEFLWDCDENEEEDMFFDENARVVSPPAKVLVPQTSTPPTFSNGLIEALYVNDMEIDKKLLKKILALPTESLIDDLILVIEDSMCRFEYFDKKQHDENDDMCWSFALVHAVFILGEIKSPRGLDTVLQSLSQSEAYIDLWYGDALVDVLYIPIFKMAKNNIRPLVDFLKKRNVYSYCKIEVAKALQQMAFHYPKRKAEIENYYSEIIGYFIENEEDGDLIDSEFLSYLVMDIRDLKLKSLSDEIEELYDTIHISETICGSLEEVFYEINQPPSKRFMQQMPDIYSCYFNFFI